MPHISRFKLDGVYIPSVSTITNSLSKDGLQRWYRKLGFDEADRQSGLARDKGTEVAEMFESYRKLLKFPRKAFMKKVLSEWKQTEAGQTGIILVAEPHLVNTVQGYHGSPDLVYNNGISWKIGDDKCKKRFADYGLLMNEHAYAMCNVIHDVETGEFKPVPWTVPIQTITFWTYHPDTGKLYPQQHEFDKSVYEDFLVCKQMYTLNRKAEAYFQEHAVPLPIEVPSEVA